MNDDSRSDESQAHDQVASYVPLAVAAELVGASSPHALAIFLWKHASMFERKRALINGRWQTVVHLSDISLIHATMYNACRAPRRRRSRAFPTFEQRFLHNNWF